MTKLAFAFLVALWTVWMAEWRIKGNGESKVMKVVVKVELVACWVDQ